MRSRFIFLPGASEFTGHHARPRLDGDDSSGSFLPRLYALVTATGPHGKIWSRRSLDRRANAALPGVRGDKRHFIRAVLNLGSGQV